MGAIRGKKEDYISIIPMGQGTTVILCLFFVHFLLAFFVLKLRGQFDFGPLNMGYVNKFIYFFLVKLAASTFVLSYKWKNR